MKKLLLVVLLSTCTVLSNAQSDIKIGYADVDYILGEMPATKKVETDLSSLKTQLTKQFELKQTELEKKYTDYTKVEKSLPEAVKNNSMRELQMLQQNLEKFNEEAQATLQKKQEEMLSPLYKAIGKAIEEVAKENGFTFILNPKVSGLDVVLFAEEKWDVSDLVLKKLGVTPKVATNDSVPKN